jgi:phosphoribosylformylglycinamidine cyclo-ligase
MADEDPEELTYAGAGVDIEASEAATAALASVAGDLDTDEYAGVLDIGDRYLALATDGVGTKLLVAEALGDYSTVGIDCIAMNVNDLVARGIDPVAFVDYLAVEEPGEETAEAIGEGLAAGAERAGVALVGGETAVMPEVIRGLDLAGACVGLAGKDDLFDGRAEPGDALVGWESSGIHSNGLTLAREAVTREHDYGDPFPGGEETIGEVLLEPTRIYADLLDAMGEHGVNAAAHVTGGGWTNLERLGEARYDITDPFDAQPVFEFVQSEGNVSDAEMHRTFNMGTGFVAALAPGNAVDLAEETGGRVVGEVREGTGVAIRGLEL